MYASSAAHKNAATEATIGLFKSAIDHHAGRRERLAEVDFTTLAWVLWFNNRRRKDPPGYPPAAEYEKQFRFSQTAPVAA